MIEDNFVIYKLPLSYSGKQFSHTGLPPKSVAHSFPFLNTQNYGILSMEGKHGRM